VLKPQRNGLVVRVTRVSPTVSAAASGVIPV
jgi:hypothetical protein